MNLTFHIKFKPLMGDYCINRHAYTIPFYTFNGKIRPRVKRPFFASVDTLTSGGEGINPPAEPLYLLIKMEYLLKLK